MNCFYYFYLCQIPYQRVAFSPSHEECFFRYFSQEESHNSMHFWEKVLRIIINLKWLCKNKNIAYNTSDNYETLRLWVIFYIIIDYCFSLKFSSTCKFFLTCFIKVFYYLKSSSSKKRSAKSCGKGLVFVVIHSYGSISLSLIYSRELSFGLFSILSFF